MRRASFIFSILLLLGCGGDVVLGPLDGSTVPDGSAPRADGSVPDAGTGADGSVPDGDVVLPGCGTLGAAVRLDDAASSAPVLGFTAVDAGDGFLVAWSKAAEGSAEARAWLARFDAAGWSEPTSFSNDVDTDELRIALDASGDGVLAWLERPTAIDTEVWAAHYLASSGVQSPVQLGDAPRHSAVVDAAASSGGAAVDWISTTDDTMAARLGADGFESPVVVGADGVVRAPRVAVDDAGNAFVIWWALRAADEDIVYAARAPAGGSFGPPVQLSPSGGRALAPRIAALPDGAIAVWYDPESYRIVQTRYRDGSGWSTAEALPSAGLANETSPELYLGPDGRGFITWTGADETGPATAMATFDPSTGFGPASQIPTRARLAVGPARSLAAWVDAAGTLQGACVGPDGAWSSATRVSHPGASVLNGAVAMTESGRGLFVYRADEQLWAVALE